MSYADVLRAKIVKVGFLKLLNKTMTKLHYIVVFNIQRFHEELATTVYSCFRTNNSRGALDSVVTDGYHPTYPEVAPSFVRDATLVVPFPSPTTFHQSPSPRYEIFHVMAE